MLVLLDDKSSWSCIFLVPWLMLTIVQKMNYTVELSHLNLHDGDAVLCEILHGTVSIWEILPGFPSWLYSTNLWDKIWNRKQGYEYNLFMINFVFVGQDCQQLTWGPFFFSRRFWRVCAGWAMARTSHAPTVMGALYYGTQPSRGTSRRKLSFLKVGVNFNFMLTHNMRRTKSPCVFCGSTNNYWHPSV